MQRRNYFSSRDILCRRETRLIFVIFKKKKISSSVWVQVIIGVKLFIRLDDILDLSTKN